MSSESYDEFVARLKSSVGKEVIYRAPDALGRPAIRMYALAIGSIRPLIWVGFLALVKTLCAACASSLSGIDAGMSSLRAAAIMAAA